MYYGCNGNMSMYINKIIIVVGYLWKLENISDYDLE